MPVPAQSAGVMKQISVSQACANARLCSDFPLISGKFFPRFSFHKLFFGHHYLYFLFSVLHFHFYHFPVFSVFPIFCDTFTLSLL